MVGMAHSICPLEYLARQTQSARAYRQQGALASFSFVYLLSNPIALAASVLSKFSALSDAMLGKADIAASVFSKFEALSEAVSVAAYSLVALCIREVAQESFD